jgi:hypothetical protein
MELIGQTFIFFDVSFGAVYIFEKLPNFVNVAASALRFRKKAALGYSVVLYIDF